jgi:hypothetical protein
MGRSAKPTVWLGVVHVHALRVVASIECLYFLPTTKTTTETPDYRCCRHCIRQNRVSLSGQSSLGAPAQIPPRRWCTNTASGRVGDMERTFSGTGLARRLSLSRSLSLSLSFSLSLSHTHTLVVTEVSLGRGLVPLNHSLSLSTHSLSTQHSLSLSHTHTRS